MKDLEERERLLKPVVEKEEKDSPRTENSGSKKGGLLGMMRQTTAKVVRLLRLLSQASLGFFLRLCVSGCLPGWVPTLMILTRANRT
jgi:hypothetical protein